MQHRKVASPRRYPPTSGRAQENAQINAQKGVMICVGFRQKIEKRQAVMLPHNVQKNAQFRSANDVSLKSQEA